MALTASSIDVKASAPSSAKTAPERGPTELQRLQKRTSHQKLLDAAYTSFAELTYAATTIDHIVSRAKVNRSTFYRHFDSKFAVAKAIFAQFWPRLFAEFDRLSSADPDEEQIEEWITDLLVFYRANKPLYQTLGQIPALEPEGARWEETVRVEIISRLGQRIPAFRRASSPTEGTPELRVRVRMWMAQFELGVFYLAFGDEGDGRPVLMRFLVREFRKLIQEEAEAAPSG